MNKLRYVALSIIFFAVLGITTLSHNLAHAAIGDTVRCGALLNPGGVSSAPSDGTTCTTNADGTAPADANTKVNNTITLVINIFSIVVGIVAVIMIVLGGLKYITSGGDSNNVTSAKNTILYAVVGLVVVALAQFIVRFVLGKVNS
jgi:cytochrome bd-type quinol oxidase subunit 2